MTAENVAALRELNRAEDIDTFHGVLSRMNAPSWNFVFADSGGNIGYYVTGQALQNTDPFPPGPQRRNLSEAIHPKLMSEDRKPQILHPKRGWLATANNQHWPTDAEFSGGPAYRTPFRAFRIEELLRKNLKHDVESMKRVQCDTQSVEGRFFSPGLQLAIERSHSLSSEIREEILKVLKAWSYGTDLDCRACGLYRLTAELLSKGWRVNTNALYTFMNQALARNDQKKIDEIASFAGEAWSILMKGRKELPTWGEIHRNYFRHISEDKRFYSALSIPTKGDDSSVNPGSSDWNGELFEQTAGASQRLIVEMTLPPKAIVQLSGVNEDIQNPPLDNESGAWKRWSRCEYASVRYPFEWKNVKTSKVSF